MLRIGSGAGFSGDRLEPAVELAEKGNMITWFWSAWRNGLSRLRKNGKKQMRCLGTIHCSKSGFALYYQHY